MKKFSFHKKTGVLLLGIILLLSVCIIPIGVKLHQSYAYFFNFLNKHHLSPVSQKVYNFGNNEAGNLNYVLLGDSLTDGVGNIDPGATLPAIYAGHLQNQQKSGTLTKLAQAGATTKDVITNQVPEAIELYPDYILIMIGTNDIHNPITPWEFQHQYSKMLDELNNKTRAEITVINIPYIGSEQILLPPWNTLLDWRMQQFNKIIQEVAKKRSIKVIDLYTATKNQFIKSSDLYSVDQFHPSDKGYRLWADTILPQW
jgi:lysophospholipase L1-like esterase